MDYSDRRHAQREQRFIASNRARNAAQVTLSETTSLPAIDGRTILVARNGLDELHFFTAEGAPLAVYAETTFATSAAMFASVGLPFMLAEGYALDADTVATLA